MKKPKSENQNVATPLPALRGAGALVGVSPQGEAELPGIVSDGWRRAQGGLVEIIRFGAMLLAVQEWLEDQSPVENGAKRGDPGYTPGLKGWLHEHCPEVNYQTAYGYLCAASGLRREARLAEGVPLLGLMGMEPVPEARAEKLRKRVQKVIAASTLSFLKDVAREQQPAPKGGAREGAGRPSLKDVDSATAAGAAWGKLGTLIDQATAWHFAAFLPEAIAREALTTVELLREGLKARLNEIKNGRQ